jgi:transposase
MATSCDVGIDVSKDRLDVAVLGERQEKQVCNIQAGIKELVQWMLELQPELIVVEATGGYQRSVVESLFHAGLSMALVNPARVRQFARACGLLAKTDKLDAQVLAEFGRRVQPRRKTVCTQSCSDIIGCHRKGIPSMRRRRTGGWHCLWDRWKKCMSKVIWIPCSLLSSNWHA